MKWTHKELMGLTVEKEKTFKHPTVEGLRLRVYPSGRKGWQWARMLEGNALRRALGKFPVISMVEAQERACELNQTFEKGVDPTALKPIEKPQCQRVKVAEGWNQYISDCERRGVRSLYKLDLTGRKDIVAALGDMLLSDVAPAHIREIVARPIARAQSMKRATQGGKTRSNAILRTVRAFLTFCVNDSLDDMQRNVALAVKPIKNIQEAPARTLSLRELALLMLSGRELDRRYSEVGKVTTWADAIAILTLNGNRKSELFDAFGDEWDVATQSWRIGGDRYKTGVNCVLPVGPTTALIMGRRAKPGEFIIPSQTGVRTGQDRHICDKLTEIMAKISGEDIKPWSMHSIRHGFRHNIRKSKITDSELAEMIIHPKREAVMERRYDNDWCDEMRAALTAWDKLLEAEVCAIMAERFAAAV